MDKHLHTLCIENGQPKTVFKDDPAKSTKKTYVNVTYYLSFSNTKDGGPHNVRYGNLIEYHDW